MSIVIAALFVLTLAQVFIFANTSADEVPGESVLRIGFVGELSTLNPYAALTDASLIFCGLVYDCLQSVDGDYGSESNLALGWGAVSETDPIMIANGKPYGSVWGFNLTYDAQWHDGEPFTADDVVFSLNLAAQNYDKIWAYQPYTYFIDYAEKLGDYTVLVHFFDRSTGEPMPVAFADSLLIPIMPKHLLESMSVNDIAFSWNGIVDGSSPPVVGTGPFKVTDSIQQEFLDGDRISLVRNPDYHWQVDKGISVSFDRLEMVFYENAATLSLALKTDHVDVAQLPTDTYTVLRTEVLSGEVEDIAVYDGPTCTQKFTYIMFNMNDRGPNKARLDPAVRQALAMATDKSSIASDHYYFGLADEGSTLVPPVNDAWHLDLPSEEVYGYDIDAANQILEDAGYVFTVASPDVRVASADSYAVQEGLVLEGTLLEFEMAVRTENPEEADIAEFLQQEWMQLGVYLDYYVVDEAVLALIVYGYNFDTAIWSWTADPDPNYILFCQSERSWNGWSDNFYSNPDYESDYNLSLGAMDQEVRREYVDNCQLIQYRDVSYIIMAYPYQTYAWRTDHFTGWGDWSEEPCRSIDAFWGGNPLYFDLEPISDEPPDEDPPTTYAFASAPDGENGWYLTSAEIQLTAMDDLSGIEYTRYRVNGGTWTDYDGPIEIAMNGQHLIQYYSVDTVGNVEVVQALEVKVDTFAPTVWILQADGIEFDSPDIMLGWSCAEIGSGICLVEIRLDDGDYQNLSELDPWPSEQDPLTTYLNLTDIDIGDHDFTVRVHDNAGHVSVASIEFSVREGTGILGMDPLTLGLLAAAIAGVAAVLALIVFRPKKGARPPQ